MSVRPADGYVGRVIPSLSDRAVSILSEARQVHVAVSSTNGPHVTPELFAWSGGRLWFASSVDTLKAAVLRRDSAIGAVVSIPGRSVVVAGEAEAFDPTAPVDLVGRACGLPSAARALASFTVRNAPDLLAFASDTLTGRLGWRVPSPRILFAIEPQHVVVLENDAVVDAAGDWASLHLDPSADPLVVEDPPAVGVPIGGQPAVLAIPGPIALPGRWFAAEQQVFVAPALRPLVPSGELELSVVVDDYSAPGPAAKQGTLVRGRGRLRPDGSGFVTVDPDRSVEWDGVDTTATDH